MNLGTLRTRVRQILGENSADFWSDAELNTLLNEALRRFTAEARWPWLATEGSSTLVATESDLDLTEGVAASRHLAFTLTPSDSTLSYQPKRVDPADGFRLRSQYGTSTAARPEFFYIVSALDYDEGDFIYLARFLPAPVGDVDVAFQYFRVPPEMDGDNDVPDLPVEFQMALAHHAAGEGWLKELNSTHAAAQFEMYASILEQARSEYLSQADDDPLVAGGEEPQWGADDETWDRRLPDLLGP